MRLTNKLYAQHLGWMFKKHWIVQGKRVPRDTGAATELQKLNITVKDVKDVLEPKVERKRYEIVGYKLPEVIEDETHPNWHSKVCHIYGNSNVLLEGIPQAQLLLKTVEINGFPKNIEEVIDRMQLSNSVDRNIQNSILAANVFDAEQVKLPKETLQDRPQINLPRIYGIRHERRFRLLINKLISECEKLTARSVQSGRKMIDNAHFSVTLPRDDDLLQFNIRTEKLLTSIRPIEPIKGQYDSEMPDLYPIKCTITIPKRQIYTTDTLFPLSKTLACSHPHTLFLHFSKEHVGNLHATSVKNTQFQSRTLIKAFAVAAARAKQLYGEDALKNLPRPIVVQSVQTDGRTFHFGVFQLNTLALGGTDGLKNYWFHKTNLDLFKECGYKEGKPYLDGYNKEVFRHIYAFYNNF